MNCPVCRGKATKRIRRLHDDRFGYPGSFDLFLCNGCGHHFLDLHFSDEQLIRLYSDYYPRSKLADSPYQPAQPSHGLASWWRGTTRSAYRWVPAGSRVLDIGCGGCESLGYLRSLGCAVQGVEADENVRDLARQQGFEVHIGTFDPALYEPNSFDNVTMDQVIEHMTDPVTTLRGIEGILKPGGLAILSTPNASGWGARLFGQYWLHWHAPYHLHHFSAASMAQAARRAGLALERTKAVTDSVWLRYQWAHLLTRPAMGQVSPFWADTDAKIGHAIIRRRVVILLHLTGVNHLLTRLFDALGQGDNQVFFLRKPL
jgi:2-polyprenyl-3-methyl-5-hydroxy-6-metoxy-1,4-benzoquinol methylase